MEQISLNKTIDEILENFDFSASENDPIECEPITFWIPRPQKEKYDLGQKISKMKLGKLIKGLVISAIDRVNLDKSIERLAV